jgi:hypothetical protein
MMIPKVKFLFVCVFVLLIGVAPVAFGDWDEGDGHKMHYPQLPKKGGLDIALFSPTSGSIWLADDWQCSRTGPVSDIHFWVSWKEDDVQPIDGFSVRIWSDDPCGPDGYSEPNELLWEREIYADDITVRPMPDDWQGWFEPYWGEWDPCDHTQWAQVNITDINDPFIQEEGKVYWLMIDMWGGGYIGWKQSGSQQFRDDAVYYDGLYWKELYDPETAGESLDLAFVITGDEEGPIVKWAQMPDETTEGIDIRIDSNDFVDRTLADDFECSQPSLITDVHFWGSWKDDIKGDIRKIHLSIHEDIPEGDPCNPTDWSIPGKLLWEKDFFAGDFNEGLYYILPDEEYEWFWDVYYDRTQQRGDQNIWQYDIYIDPCEAFLQLGTPEEPIIYWLDIYVETEDDFGEFGWKTSLDHWNDKAVQKRDDPFWQDLTYPPDHPYAGSWISMAFVITSQEVSLPKPLMAHTKWSQPPVEVDPNSEVPTYCGWDEESHDAVDFGTPLMKVVADDFRCIGSMPVTSIHWWGSFYDWEWWAHGTLPAVVPEKWWIGFWSNVQPPPGADPNYSYPDILLHSITIPAERVDFEEVGSDEYYGYHPYDICYQYNVELEPEEVFWQDDFNEVTDDDIYWISIVAEYNDVCEPYYKWGWKSRPWSWMDDAVTFVLPAKPDPGFATGDPCNIMPIKDLVWQESFDMAFELDTDPNYIKWEQFYTGIRHWPHYEDEKSMDDVSIPENIRGVADDWRCLRRTPVTAISWWGSYIGYSYEACSYGPFMPLPVPPDYFVLTMWSDVPAGSDPCYPFSHPNEPIWEYWAYDYDEVLVGYDKHPHGAPSEPVFRYSVRLPEEEWFKQRDVNSIFWLSVLAVYEVNAPNYDWGWTNHQHMFNDNAVAIYIDLDSGELSWEELYDQTGVSEDMSFMLFTDPNECINCADYNKDDIINFKDYAYFANDWLWTGMAGGYNNSDLDCNGIVDLYDLKIFAEQWLDSCP